MTDPQPCPDPEQGDPAVPENDAPPPGGHVVVTPQTAGSAGAAQKES